MVMRKGISPLIAAVLLVAFTLSVAGLFGGWVPDLLQGLQSGVSEDTRDVASVSQSSIEVESVGFDGENVSGVIRNTGSEALSNFTVTVRGDSPRQVRVREELEPGELTGFEVGGVSGPDSVSASSENVPVSDEEEISSEDDGGGGSGSVPESMTVSDFEVTQS